MPHLLVPSKKQSFSFRKDLMSSDTWQKAEISRIVSVDMDQVSRGLIEDNRPGNFLPSRFSQYAKVDYAIASLQMRAASDVEGLTDRVVQARYGDAGTHMVAATRGAGVKDPCDKVIVNFLKRLDLACMMFNRTSPIQQGVVFELLLDASPAQYEVQTQE